MNRLIAATALTILIIIIIIPALIIFFVGKPPEAQTKKMFYKGEDISIKVYMHEQKQVVEMSLEEYVKGVVAAEMPAEFDLEALKAQAVATRTYAVKHMQSFGGSGAPDYPGADVTTDYHKGQAWLSQSVLKSRWGPFNYEKYWKKISQAVDETRGIILIYQNEPINAVFHSTAGPRTASAKEVWGFDYPYLKSVECKWDTASPRYTETKEFSLNDIENILGTDAGVIAAAQNGSGEITKIISLTESGRVDKVRIGSKTFTGAAAREKLNLRSANFTIEYKNDKLVFNTIGYGHGVGMSQYGANGMAKAGHNYKDILLYFYQGVNLKNIYGS